MWNWFPALTSHSWGSNQRPADFWNRKDDAISPASPAAVIGYRYWQRRFGLNANAIGQAITLQNKVFTIVGVTPRRYQGTRPGRDPDVTLPLSMMLSERQRREAGFNDLNMMARLAIGATIQQANAELQVLWRAFAQRLAAAAPEKERPAILRQRAAVLRAPDGFNPLKNDYSEPLLVLMGIVALVLLLACVNLSGLLLARAASRQHEIAIRLAIGAGGGWLMRQFLAESLVLAALGGSAGLLLARWFSGALVAMMANGSTLLISTVPDWRVLAFTAAISLAACLLAGLAPGWGSSDQPESGVKRGARGGPERPLGPPRQSAGNRATFDFDGAACGRDPFRRDSDKALQRGPRVADRRRQ